jgi:serine/threonine protein kinase/Tfp pilus assembly protein PilF
MRGHGCSASYNNTGSFQTVMSDTIDRPPSTAKQIFLEALDLPADQRAALLDARCGADTALRTEVESLLSASDSAGEFLSGTEISPPPAAIGPYKLLQVIGEGGFGSVYMAEQERPVRRRVALKLIKLGMDTKQVVARFEAERQALAMMDHPGIARVFDAGATSTGRPYFVMELVGGIPITEYCDKGRLTIESRLQLFAQVCQAVQHAHQKGIIHRDIKPSNILVSDQDDKPVAKVIDFGIAKATQTRLTEKTVFTEMKQLIGTPEYMSPEQADSSLDIDTRTDIYSLGVVLYELLTGTTPFDARELRSQAYGELQRIIREVDPPRPSTRLSTMRDTLPDVAARRRIEPRRLEQRIRGDLDWIILKAMEKDRSRRYESAADLASDVLRHLADKPVSARPPTTGYLLRKFARRHRGAVIASAVVLAVLVAGIIGTTIGLLRAQYQRAEAQRQTAIANAVSVFQAEMLASADPERSLGDKVTVAQAMMAAMKELDAGKLSKEPLVEANIRTIVGNTLQSLGRYDEAEPNLRRAIELYRQEPSRLDLHTAVALRNLALLLEAQGKLVETERCLREALEIQLSKLPANHREVVITRSDLAAALCKMGRFAESESLSRDVLRLRREILPAGDLDIATSLNNLSQVLQFQGKLVEAESFLREGLEISRKARPEGHPKIGTGLSNLGMLLMAQGKYVDAEPFLREALQIRQRALPPDHPDVAASLNNLGGALKNQGKFSEAEPLWRQALEINRKTLPPAHPHTAATINNLARLLEAQGNLAEAEHLFHESLAMRRRSLPPGHPDIAQGLSNLAGLLSTQKRWTQAEPLYREAIDYYEKKLGKDNIQTASTRTGLGTTLRALNRFSEAEQELLEAERVLSASPASPRRAQCIEALASLYGAWNQAEPGKGFDIKAERWKSLRSATTRTN